MSGRVVGIFLILFTAVFGAGVYYAQIYAYFEPAQAVPEAEVLLLPTDGGAPRALPVRDLTFIDKKSSPLGYRACFQVDNSLAMLTETYALADDAVPLVAPGWFDCYDADEIGTALETGAALAFQGRREVGDGVDEVVVVMPDGRGFAWHQLNDKYSETGNPLTAEPDDG